MRERNSEINKNYKISEDIEINVSIIKTNFMIHTQMLSIKTMINDICNVSVLINNQVKLAKANEKQFKTLNERVIIVVTTLRGRGFELIEKKSDYCQTSLKLLYDCLNQCLEFMKKFSINNSFQHLLLKTSDYKDQFKKLNKNLQTAIIQLNLAINVQLIFDREQDRRNHNDDIIVNQTIIETNTALLEKSNLTHLNYDFLTMEFKVGLSAITKFQRHAVVDEKGQYPSIKQFWNDHPELHRTWIKYIPF